MANNSGSNVPKFSSFKPKPKRSIAQENAESSSARNDNERREVRLGRHRVEKSRSTRDRPPSTSRSPRDADHCRTDPLDQAARRYDSRSRDPRIDRNHRRTSDRDDEARRDRPHRQSSEERPSDLYTVDLKGDLANSQYRQSNKWNVSLYHLYGSGSLVGHDPDVKIDRQLSNEHGYTLRYPPRKQHVRRAGLVEVDEMFEPPPGVMMVGGDDHESFEKDFLPLPKPKRDEAQRTPIVTPKV